MFDVGLTELIVLAIIALVVLGPEKLPHAARMAGAWMGRIRRMIINVQADIESEVAAQEMRERIRKEMEKVTSLETTSVEATKLETTESRDDEPTKPT